MNCLDRCVELVGFLLDLLLNRPLIGIGMANLLINLVNCRINGIGPGVNLFGEVGLHRGQALSIKARNNLAIQCGYVGNGSVNLPFHPRNRLQYFRLGGPNGSFNGILGILNVPGGVGKAIRCNAGNVIQAGLVLIGHLLRVENGVLQPGMLIAKNIEALLNEMTSWVCRKPWRRRWNRSWGRWRQRTRGRKRTRGRVWSRNGSGWNGSGHGRMRTGLKPVAKHQIVVFLFASHCR